MPRLGLALSGGGFRATLYHLGVIRYLKDTGQLEHVTDIASVSGGSILAAHLTLNWDRYTGDDERFDEAAAEIIKFVQFDVRNHVVRRLPLQHLMRWLARITLFDRDRFTPNASLERCYRKLLYGDRCLYELPEHPKLHILATNISSGGMSVFNRQGLFIQRRGASDTSTFEYVPGEMTSVPRAVGASSAFPGLFPPVKMTSTDLGVREGEFTTEWFTDGGVYDNLGIRAFSWLKQQEAVFDEILVSDAGKPFQILGDATLGFVGQSVRATDILWDRVWQLEKQNFGEQPGFFFLPITKSVTPAEDPTALPTVVQAEVQSIRTDLDHFSDKEINVLVQHGYEVARQVCRENNMGDAELSQGAPWAPIPSANVITQVSTTAHSDEPSAATQLSRDLRKSGARRVWSTLFSPGDWTSYLYVILALMLLVYFPWQAYKVYRRSQIQATVIKAIADGDPDIRQILDLVDKNPALDWQAETIRETVEPTTTDYTGLEVLTYSRIVDLRHWRPHEPKANRGHVYVRDRYTLKLLDSYVGDRHLRMVRPLPTDDIEFRQSGSQIPAIITRVQKPAEEYGAERTLFEFEYDLSRIPLGEPVTLELEALLQTRDFSARAPFVSRAKIDLISVWMLFPADRPYRTYSLVRYPLDRSKPPEVMNSRYAIDHPYGSLIGWSVVNAERNMVYECRWTSE
ncbi:Patatin-like phospholipase [Symmachiella macrocystis]|uniref:Patatin-like phospholipase n=1 Tax=Symmachiella macrocystis TaxID=2527985 RepID=A0A5C6BJK8_9PLAN|nr:patatin-like phospholipase family protein [Symmachiella macrocystis]TWU11751.1 Patatin-like phospholipase [Symmachiella macrocystis]